MLDRDGEIFSEILNFLRRGSIPLSRPRKELENILAEAEFYQIQPLICVLKEKLLILEERQLNSGNSPKYHLIVDGNRPLVTKESFKPLFHLFIGSICQDPSIPAELAIFADLCREYGDVLEFSLILDKDRANKFWFLEAHGMNSIVMKSMVSIISHSFWELSTNFA